MKKLLALILCLITCISLFSCSQAEMEETNEEENVESEPPAETEKNEPERIIYNLVVDNRIVFPDKDVSYIKYEKREQIPPYDSITVERKSFYSESEIKNIIEFFENITLEPWYTPQFSREIFVHRPRHK